MFGGFYSAVLPSVAIDIAITVLAALVFGPGIAMYGIITVAVTGTVVDLVFDIYTGI